MSDTIYAPPEAEIEVDAADSDQPDYYVVAPTKFLLLAILTLNAYVIYWFYRNWRAIKVRTRADMWPPMRGLFYIFFTHSLFANVNEYLTAKGKSFDWQPSGLATLVVTVTILQNVLDRLAARSIGSPSTDIISTALVFAVPWLLLKAQRAINFACDDPNGDGNSSLTLANWIWMVLGGLLWLLALFGLYVIFFAPELLVE